MGAKHLARSSYSSRLILWIKLKNKKSRNQQTPRQEPRDRSESQLQCKYHHCDMEKPSQLLKDCPPSPPKFSIVRPAHGLDLVKGEMEVTCQESVLRAKEHLNYCAIVKTSPGTAVSQMDAKALPGETQSESLQCRTAGPQGTMRQQVRDPPAVKAGPRPG